MSVTENFRDYFVYSSFTVYTDNNPLVYLQLSSKLSAFKQCLVSGLAVFHFEIKYRCGKGNANADALFRKSCGKNNTGLLISYSCSFDPISSDVPQLKKL